MLFSCIPNQSITDITYIGKWFSTAVIVSVIDCYSAHHCIVMFRKTSLRTWSYTFVCRKKSEIFHGQKSENLKICLPRGNLWNFRIHLFQIQNCYSFLGTILFEPQRVSSKDSDQPVHPCSLFRVCCPHEETLHPWLSQMLPVKILIDCPIAQADLNLCWAHMSESTLWRNGSYIFLVLKVIDYATTPMTVWEKLTVGKNRGNVGEIWNPSSVVAL